MRETSDSAIIAKAVDDEAAQPGSADHDAQRIVLVAVPQATAATAQASPLQPDQVWLHNQNW